MVPMEPAGPAETSDATPPAVTEAHDGINWSAVARGAAIGAGVVIVAAALHAVFDHNIDDFDETGWVLPLFVLVLVGYGLAGWTAQRLAAQHAAAGSPLTHGALAGIGVLVIWFPIRVLIWVARDEDRALFSGNDPALRPGQIFGHLVIATALGMLGAFFAARLARRAGKQASA
jgi:hypothetical protein